MIKPIRMVFSKLPLSRTAGLVGLSVLCFCAGRASVQAASNVVLWDTGSHFAGSPNVEDRGAWRVVPPDLLTLEANPPKASSDPGYYGREYAFRGDAVVENQRVLAVLSGTQGTLVLFSKTDAGTSGDSTRVKSPIVTKILELRLADSKSPALSAAAELTIVRDSEDEVAVQIAFGSSPKSKVLVDVDRTQIVSVTPSAEQSQFVVQAPLAYAVAPAFIGDDLIFGPQAPGPTDSLAVPAENLLLGLLQGEGTEFVMTWPKGQQRVELVLSPEADGRRGIDSIKFDSAGESFYLAPLDAPGIWHQETLKPGLLEKDVAIKWHRPFEARWKTQLYEEALRTTFAFRQAKGEIWRGVAGSYQYPVWFEGDTAFYHLSKKVPPKGESLVYFLEGQGTPVSILTPADILKATVGRPLADTILDAPGRKLRTHHRRGENGVHRACTCGCTEAIQAVFEAHQEVERKDDIKGDLEDMVYFVHAHVQRIAEYRRFADDCIRELESAKSNTPELGEYVDKLEEVVRQIPRECSVQQENMKSFAYADELVRKTLALTDKDDPKNLAAYMDLLKDWRAMGGAQDYVVAQCHIITRKLAQEAGYGCAKQLKAVPLAQGIRTRARHCLRNADGYEIWAEY